MDEGFSNIWKLVQLESLDLSGCYNVTDIGCLEAFKLKEKRILKWIDIKGCSHSIAAECTCVELDGAVDHSLCIIHSNSIFSMPSIDDITHSDDFSLDT